MNYLLLSLLIMTSLMATPAFGQLCAPQTGQMGQMPLTYYRVGLVSIDRKLSRNEGDGLLLALKDEAISEKYIIRLKPNTDGTYELEMLIRIIFFDKKEADMAVELMKQTMQYQPDKFVLEVVQEHQ